MSSFSFSNGEIKIVLAFWNYHKFMNEIYFTFSANYKRSNYKWIKKKEDYPANHRKQMNKKYKSPGACQAATNSVFSDQPGIPGPTRTFLIGTALFSSQN